jgi:hypothetical protein
MITDELSYGAARKDMVLEIEDRQKIGPTNAADLVHSRSVCQTLSSPAQNIRRQVPSGLIARRRSPHVAKSRERPSLHDRSALPLAFGATGGR